MYCKYSIIHVNGFVKGKIEIFFKKIHVFVITLENKCELVYTFIKQRKRIIGQEDNLMSFGNRLRKLRKENNLSQKELAKKFNTSKTAISNYENNYRKPNMDLIVEFASFFNVTVDYLLDRTDIRNINLPKEIRNFIDKYGIDYIESAKFAQEKGIPPEDVKTIIETFEEIKPLIDRLNNN